MAAVGTQPGVEQEGPRRARMTRAERREHFLDVAAEVVVEAGVDAVTMERVAGRAGVSKALGYAYFENRDALLAALFDREMASYDAAITAAVRDAPTFEARLRATVVVLFDAVAERGRLLGALLDGQAPAGSLADRRRARKADGERFFGRMIAEEHGLPMDEAVTVAAVWLSATSGLIDSWLERRGSRRELTDTFVALMLGGVDRVARR